MEHLPGFAPLADRFDGFILDLWGVIHDGVNAFPHAVDCLTQLRAAGKRTLLLSNVPRPMDWAMVLPVRIRMVKKTASRIRVTSAPMSPICLANPIANSFSGCVLVSSGEFMKSVSIEAEIPRAWVESAMRSMYQPVLPRPVWRASSK